MANIKISQLPFIGATYNLGTIFPIVYQGVTYQTNLTSLISVIASGGIQQVSNITQSIYADGASTVKYPSAIAVKTYADGLVVGLLDDRGNYTPDIASPGAYPSTGGSGTAGAVLKGDLWFIDTPGYLGTNAVVIGASVRAIVDFPNPAASGDWDILDAGVGYIPENVANKSTDVTLGGGSANNILYPSQLAVKTYIDNQVGTSVTLQGVLDNNHDLVDGINLQGTGAGASMGAVTEVTAMGTSAAAGNTGSNIVALGDNAANANIGNFVAAIGSSAAINNSGNYVVAIGGSSAESNSGSNVFALGATAASYNTQDEVIAIGTNSAKQNTGAGGVIALGENAARTNTGGTVNAIGYGSAQGNSGNYVNAFGNNAGSGNSFNHVNLFGQNANADSDNQLAWCKDGSLSMKLDANGINADRKLTMPDADGTVVLSVNGNTPDAQGDVTLTIPTPPSGLPYLCYSAFLQFGPGTVTATQIYNTIGDGSGDGINDIAWSNTLYGSAAIMSNGPFTSGKTVVVPGGYFGNGVYFALIGSRVSSAEVNVNPFNIATQNFGRAYTSGIYIEIRVYP